jgi:WD40 repeat protein
VKGLAFSPDGRHILSGSNDKTVRLWDVASGKELTRLDGHTEGVSNVCFSPDGHFAASGSWDHTVRLWDLDRGRQAHALKHGDYVVGVAFSPDGRQLASGSWDRLVRLWDVKTGRELHRFKGHSDRAGDVAFSQDGHYLLSSSTDQTLRLWGVDTGREVSLCQVGADAGWAVAISPDGQRALSVHGADVVLWDLATSQPIHRFQGHTDQVADLAFSPDGRFALSSSQDGSIRLWGLPSESAPTPAEPPLLAHQSERPGATADISTSAPAQSMALAGNPPAAPGGNAAIFLTSPDGQVIPVADGPVSADELRKALARARECPPDASGGLSTRPPVQSSDTKDAAPKPPSPKPRQAPAPPAVAIIPEKSWFALNTEDEAPPSLASVLRLGAPKLCSKDRSLGTALTWAESPSQAFEQAKSEGKLVLLLHVSGNFEDPGFT